MNIETTSSGSTPPSEPMPKGTDIVLAPARGTGPVDLARVFKALGDPTRLAIFELVRASEADGDAHTRAEIDNSVSRIASRFDLSLSTVSHHIKELREAGVIRCERRGQTIRCSIEPGLLEQVERFLEGSDGR